MFGRDRNAAAGPGERTEAGIDGERQRREAGLIADSFGDVLVERNRVAEGAAGRMRGRGEETDVRRVASVDVGMGDAEEDGEVLAEVLEDFQIASSGEFVGNWGAQDLG